MSLSHTSMTASVHPQSLPEPSDSAEHDSVSVVNGSRPLRLGVLSNAQSGRNRRGGLKSTLMTLEQFDHVPHFMVNTPAEVAHALEQLSAQGADLVAINAGDGTVQAALTCLFRDRPFDKLPLLAILPAGTTNMTAGDIGVGRSHRRSLLRLLRWSQNRDRKAVIESRSVLRVQAHPKASPVYGMFFGAAGIVQGIRFCRSYIHTRGLRGEIGPGLATARLIFDVSRGHSQHLESEIVTVSLESGPDQRQKAVLVLVSTLERLFLGLRPYWGRENGPLHYTAIQARPRYLIRVLPWMLRGRRHPRLNEANGYVSHNVGELRLTLDTPFTVDGELFPTDAKTGPVSLSCAGEVTFVRL